jgi:hypothetical protein
VIYLYLPFNCTPKVSTTISGRCLFITAAGERALEQAAPGGFSHARGRVYKAILNLYIVIYTFNICYISILDDVVRELIGKRKKCILREILIRHRIIDIET